MSDQAGSKPEAPEISTREECWKQSIYTFGTGAIFEARAKRIRQRLQLLNFLGLAIPVVVGGAALAFTTNSAAFATLFWIAGLVLLPQLLLSLGLLVGNWIDELAYSVNRHARR